MPRQILLPFQIDNFGRIAFTENLAKQLADNIISIVGTQPGQRRMRPDYGVDLEGYLFKPLTPGTVDRLKVGITTAVNRYEPRVQIIKIEDVSTPKEGLLGVRISFAFVTASDAQSQTYVVTVLPGGELTS